MERAGPATHDNDALPNAVHPRRKQLGLARHVLLERVLGDCCYFDLAVPDPRLERVESHGGGGVLLIDLCNGCLASWRCHTKGCVPISPVHTLKQASQLVSTRLHKWMKAHTSMPGAIENNIQRIYIAIWEAQLTKRLVHRW